MESVGILRVLWRRRLLVAIGGLLAVAVGLLGMYRVSLAPPGLQGRMVTSSRALQRVLVDTPKSLVADARAKGAESIVAASELLGDQMASDQAVAAMARKADLAPAEIGVIGPGAATPDHPTPLAEQATEVARPVQPYVVSISAEPGLPILSVLTTAPDPRGAGRLAEAAALTLASLGRETAVAGGNLKIERIGEVTIGSSVAGGRKKAAIGALFVFLLWCIAVIAFDGVLRRQSRGGREREESFGSLYP